MSTAELKEEVIQRIVNIQDDFILKDIISLLDIEYSKTKVKLTPEEKEAIDIGLAEIKEGNTFTNEEVEREMQQLLNNEI